MWFHVQIASNIATKRCLRSSHDVIFVVLFLFLFDYVIAWQCQRLAAIKSKILKWNTWKVSYGFGMFMFIYYNYIFLAIFPSNFEFICIFVLLLIPNQPNIHICNRITLHHSTCRTLDFIKLFFLLLSLLFRSSATCFVVLFFLIPAKTASWTLIKQNQPYGTR